MRNGERLYDVSWIGKAEIKTAYFLGQDVHNMHYAALTLRSDFPRSRRTATMSPKEARKMYAVFKATIKLLERQS